MNGAIKPRISGLDSIRALCALWVLMGHTSSPPLMVGCDENVPIVKIVSGVYNNLWNGPPAVIVFFVISGFCIHYPNTDTLQLKSIAQYVFRRAIRVLIPMFIAMYIGYAWLNVELTLLNVSILWSLVAELVYYFLYPSLLVLRRQVGSWMPILVASFALAFLLAIVFPAGQNYASFGNYLNWLMGLPCWICGCVLADKFASQSKRVEVNFKTIVFLRIGVLAFAATCSILRFHTPIGYPWTLNVFSLAAATWLYFEINWFQHHKPNYILEWMGKWSYSTYLFHLHALKIFNSFERPNFGYFINWTLQMLFMLALSYVFYLLFEKSSHMIARKACETKICT